MFFVFGKEQKGVKNVQQRARPKEYFFFFGLEGAGAFYSPSTLEGIPFSNGLGLG